MTFRPASPLALAWTRFALFAPFQRRPAWC